MVEWKKLGELCIIRTGKLNANAQVENGIYPFFTCDAHPFRIDEYAFDTEAILISGNGSQVGHLNYYKGKFNAYQRTYVLDDFKKVDIFYVLHYLKGTIRSYVMGKSKKGSVPYITLPMLLEFLIPIPSHSEQSRIVSILDTFTSSISNLKQQIEERRKQYEYERDLLLDLEGKEGVEMKKLGEVAKVLRGKRLTKNLLDDDAPYPVFHGGIEPLGRFGNYNREANTVMVINVGASAGTVAFCDCKFWSSDGCFCISHSEVLNNKFLFYYLETKTHYLQSQVRHAGIPTLDNPVIEKVLVPLLSLQAQSRIVSILDTFEQSIANLEEQLAMREKQYEYYRNQLLTFEGEEERGKT